MNAIQKSLRTFTKIQDILNQLVLYSFLKCCTMAKGLFFFFFLQNKNKHIKVVYGNKKMKMRSLRSWRDYSGSSALLTINLNTMDVFFGGRESYTK